MRLSLQVRSIPATTLGALVGLAALAPPGQHLGAQTTVVRDSVFEVWSTKGEDLPGGPLGAVSGLTVDADGDIWISDPVGRRVVVLDPQGKAKSVAARQGDGPGEVRSPNQISSRGEIVAVYDLAQLAVNFFASDENFTRRTPIRARVTWVKGMALLPHGFVLSGGMAGSQGSLFQFDSDGGVVAVWDKLPDAESWIASIAGAGGSLTLDSTGTLFFSRAAPHQLIAFEASAAGVFGANGRVLAAFADLITAPGDSIIRYDRQDTGVPTQSFRPYARSVGAFILPGGLLLNAVVFPHRHRTLLQWHHPRTGELVAERWLDGAVRPWATTNDGNLIVTRLDAETDEWIVALLAIPKIQHPRSR